MSDPHTDLDRQITELEAMLALDLPDVARQALATKRDALRAQREGLASSAQIPTTVGGDAVGGDKVSGDKVGGDKVVGSQGSVRVGDDGRVNGVVVGVNLGRIIYGRDPEDDERRRLVWYLSRLSAKLYRLPLRGLDEKLDQGKGLSLPQVYVMSAVSTRDMMLDEGKPERIMAYFEDHDLQKGPKESYHIDYALPTQAIVGVAIGEENSDDYFVSYPRVSDVDLNSITTSDTLQLFRSCLATEEIIWLQKTWYSITKQERTQYPASNQVVLLGDPGSGKSTFIRHLAWALAQRGLDQQSDATALVGWEDRQPLLPIILPLRTLAGRLATQGVSDQTIYAALLVEVESYNIARADDMLSATLHRGAALLLFDGLDEVPLDAVASVTTDRHTVVRAVRNFAQMHNTATVVLTCRSRAFDQTLREELGWPAATIAPFTLGQIRHFVPAWYGELVQCGQLEAAQAERLSQQLINTIIASPALRAMASTPLLLTMMALVLYNKGDLPRDRPQLYERILELLLGQWDKVRDGQSLVEALSLPDWGSERIRPLLDQLSFQAHDQATSDDGRGQLRRRDVREALERFLTQAGLAEAQAAAASVRCLDYFNQRSGLLVPDSAQDSYVLAHLTLQEHCAGRALVLDPDAAALVLRYRGDDRWREPIMLGLGVAQQTNPALIDRVLSDLIDPYEGNQAKQIARWQRDLIFAAEIGRDRDWGYLRTQRVNVERLQRDLRRGLVALLGDKNQPLPVAERVRAGFLLGSLGDPRYPVTVEQWKREIDRAVAGDTSGYLCCVEAGDYIIGSADDDPDIRDNEKPQHTVLFDAPFFIARYPITNEQWQAWVQVSSKASFLDNNTAFSQPNQPVIAVDWRMVNEFCAWLSEQIGATVQLPNEAEWEAAARGGNARRYPWGDEWHDDLAATEENQEARGWRWSVPIGCYSAGAAPCGAFDMAGNVWEWTADQYHSHPGAEKPFTHGRVVVRGGYYRGNRTYVRCAARLRISPVNLDVDAGFRVVVSLRLAH